MGIMSAVELLERHRGIELLSLDFFDTLVTRRLAQPTHVFAEMERRLLANGGHRWRGLALARVRAEQRARHDAWHEDRWRDVTLAEIVAQLAESMTLDPDEVLAVSELERQVELEMVMAVPFGLELVAEARARGLKLMVVSDNYMPAGHLAEMAARAGYEGLDESRFLVSCEHGGMKHNGRLFRELLDVTGVGARSILHVGDDREADVDRPSRLGMATHRDPRMRVSHRHMENTSPEVLALSRLEAHLRDTTYDGGWDPMRAVASGGLALIVAGQVADAVAVTRRRPVEGVYFAARDGWLAHQVWTRATHGVGDVPGHYLAFSRSVFGRANITKVDEHVATRFIDDHESISPRQLARRFDCDIATSLDPDVAVDAATARGLMIDNAEAVLDACRSLRARVVGYLDTVGILRPGHHVVCDAGWTGTTVADLADIVAAETAGAATIEGRFLGLYWEGTPNRTRLAMTGVAMDDLGRLDDNVRLLGAIQYFETLMSAPDGSVIDFAGADSGFAPIMSRNATEAGQHEAVLRPMAEWIIESALSLIEGNHESGVSIKDIDGAVVWATMMQLAHTPRPDELDRVGRLRHVSSLDHGDDGRTLVAKAPRFSSTIPIERYGSIYEGTMKRHWLQGSVRSWSNEPSSRLFASEMVRLWPHLGPCWMEES